MTTKPKAPTTTTIGEITIDATNTEASVASYVAASTGDKTKIRNAVTVAMGTAVKMKDMPGALAWSELSDAIAAAVTKTVAEVDYNQVVADRIIALTYAAHLLTMGDVTPEGIDADKVNNDRINELVKAWRDQADLDAVTNDQADAGKRIAGTKITRSTVRGSVEAHIETAFADVASGTFLTVAQIRTKSGAASDGAIAARVWPVSRKGGVVTPIESTLDFTALGVTPSVRDGVRGLTKN